MLRFIMQRCKERPEKRYYLEDVFDRDYAPEIIHQRNQESSRRMSEIIHQRNQESSRRMSIEQKKKTTTIEVVQQFSRRYGLSYLNYCAKKQRVGSYCPFDCLPESIVHDILSRLSIPDLFIASQSCRSWYRIVSSCQIFRELYDERNVEPWIALCSSSSLNPNGFVLFNANDAKQYHFLSLTKSWLLVGVAEGLLLWASREGRLAVANPLTRRFRLLPDAKLSRRLGLESCLKKKLWEPRLNKKAWQQNQVPPMSINIARDSTSSSFKVMVLGEVRDKEVHALVYSSITHEWTIQFRPELSHLFFRYLSHSTTDGTTIYCNSVRRCQMLSYNTQTRVSIVEEMRGIHVETRLGRAQTIGMVAYNSQIFLLGVHHEPLRPSTLVSLWASNPNAHQWRLVTKVPLDWGGNNPVDWGDSCEAAAAYDGEHSVSIILRKEWKMRLLKLNLDTNECKTDGNLQQLTWASLISRGASHHENQPPFKAFQMQLKFCTAL